MKLSFLILFNLIAIFLFPSFLNAKDKCHGKDFDRAINNTAARNFDENDAFNADVLKGICIEEEKLRKKYNMPTHKNFRIKKNQQYVSYDLRSLHKDPVTKFLRNTFDDYVDNYKFDEVDQDARPFTKEQFNLLKEKFITWDIIDNLFGGYNIFIAFQDKNAKHIIRWRVWIYPIDRENNQYEIREIAELPYYTETDESDFLKILDDKYLDLWMEYHR